MIILKMLNCGAAPAQIGIAVDPYGEELGEHVIYNLVIALFLFMQNGTTESVKKLVEVLNHGDVPSEDVVGM